MAILDCLSDTLERDDILWVLGDVCLGDRVAGLGLLNGIQCRKFLVTGNHDHCWAGGSEGRRKEALYRQTFEYVTPFAKIKIPGGADKVLLSHFPYEGGGDHTPEERFAQFRLPDLGRTLLHGHTHTRDIVSLGPNLGLQVHVGWDAWGRPVEASEVTSVINKNTEREI